MSKLTKIKQDYEDSKQFMRDHGIILKPYEQELFEKLGYLLSLLEGKDKEIHENDKAGFDKALKDSIKVTGVFELVLELAKLNGTTSALSKLDASAFSNTKETAQFVHEKIYFKTQ
ncbi:hypothetical protein D3C71_1278260 [compost metagenome]